MSGPNDKYTDEEQASIDAIIGKAGASAGAQGINWQQWGIRLIRQAWVDAVRASSDYLPFPCPRCRRIRLEPYPATTGSGASVRCEKCNWRLRVTAESVAGL